MQEIVEERTRVMGPCTNLHPGDIAHRIYSGLRGRNLSELVPVWEDGGMLVAFGIVWPQDRTFDVVVRIGADRSTTVEAVCDIAGTIEADGSVSTDVIGDDLLLAGVLVEHGFAAGPANYVVTEAVLSAPLVQPAVGYELRDATTADAAELAAVHASSFGNRWTPSEYAHRMQMPGYDPRNEIVAVDERGRFMGFAVTWHDKVNRVGYFEPVGVHSDFHRCGVGSALLTEGKRRMLDAEMETATVWHSRTEPGVTAFYARNGFQLRAIVTQWTKG